MHLVKATVFTALLVFVMSVCCSFAADVAKIGIVDLQRVVEESEAGKAANAEITKEGKEMQIDLKKKEQEIRELKERLEREEMVMSSETYQEKEREYKIKLMDIQNLQKKYMAQLQELEKKHMTGMNNELKEVVKEIGKKNGYLLIIPDAAVLYAPSTNDITDELIKAYNAVYAKKKNQ